MSCIKKISSRLLSGLLLILMAAGTLHASTVAFLGARNMSGSAEYDYLAAFTEGVILFDLSRTTDIILVERQRLEKILSEQQLQLTGLVDGSRRESSMKAGRLLAADSLVSVDYTIVGGEVAFTLRVADTGTGGVKVIRSRGIMENDIHALSEGLVRALTGKSHTFINEAEKRSLLTLRDMVPGSITLYCNLVKAEIMLDGKFVAYTGGDLYKPLEIKDIDPGTYTMKIHLSQDFGVVKLPQFTFSDWEEKVTIRPGRSSVTRAVIYHFNDTIYRAMRLYDADFKLTEKEPSVSIEKDISFTDREGRAVAVKIKVSGKRSQSDTRIFCTIVYNGKKQIIDVNRKGPEQEKGIGKIKVKMKLDTSGSGMDRLSVDVDRTDIHQGMHREQ